MKQQVLTSDFLRKFTKDAALPTAQLDKFIRVAGSDIGEALIVGNQHGPGTPVDTGNARGHWYTTLGEAGPGNPHPPAVDAHGKAIAGASALTASAMADAGTVAAQAKFGDVVSFNNDCAYIEELNNGHSQQAPNGIIDVVAQNFDAICENAARKVGLIPGGE